ncbi:hypothetical protein VTL71DRAFT_11175 [Oculimacula yallundae]|uniref:Cyanovirin-N domain-containing protein n=1 Tax=Oculimacula yallundae TaxID=86028 RepID=A0ABR4CXR0_9HELO
MLLRHISARLLLLGFVSSSVIPQDDEDLPIQFCGDVNWDSISNDVQSVSCIEHFEAPSNISSEQVTTGSCPGSTDHLNSTFSNGTVHTLDARYFPNNADASEKGRHACYNKDLPFRSQMLPASDDNQKRWCFREGALPKQSDVMKLCYQARVVFESSDKIKRIFQIQRAKWASNDLTEDNNGNCFCHILRVGTAGLKICNCDRCDALQVEAGVGDICQALQKDCIENLFGSGYLRAMNPNVLFALYGHKDKKGGIQQQIELDPVLGVDGVMTSTCKSGDENRRGQDYTGLILNCSWKNWWRGNCSRRCQEYDPNCTYGSSKLEKWAHKLRHWRN